MKAQTQIGLAMFALGLAGSIYSIANKKNIVLDAPKKEESARLINISTVSFLVFGIGSGLVLGNVVEISAALEAKLPKLKAAQ